MKIRNAAVALLAGSLLACEPVEQVPAEAGEPVVVYAAFADTQRPQQLLAGFTRQTGVPVTLQSGEPKQIVNTVMHNSGSPPADVLLTASAADIWLAADEGALRAQTSDALQNTVDKRLRGLDNQWFAISVRRAEIVLAGNVPPPETVTGYSDLAEAAFADSLCLSTSLLAINRAVIAGLIAEHGVRPAERIVRLWLQNLAQPVFATEAALLEAVHRGQCPTGIASSDAISEFREQEKNAAFQVHRQHAATADVVAAGVARHARNPDGALQLIEWLVERHYPGAAGVQNLAQQHTGLSGWHEEEVRNLLQRARYR